MDNLSQLIKKAKEGNRDAFGQIYNLFYRRIFRYCKFNLRNEQDSQDICQETFLKAWKSISNFTEKKGGSFQAYLFRIARNLIIDASRKKKEVQLKEYLEIESEENLDEHVDKESENQKVKTAIGKLKEKDRQIILLRYFEEMTTAEVAKVIGTKEGAIRVRIHRILKNLREIIQKGSKW